MKAVSNANVRLKNINNVYKVLHRSDKGLTIRDIGEQLKLSLPTVNTCVSHLLEKGLIEYGALEQSTGGRKPRSLHLVANAKLAVGMVIAAGSLRFLLSNLKGEVLEFRKEKLPFADEAGYYEDASARLESFIADTGIAEERLLGVGVAVAGIVRDKKILEAVPTLKLKDKPIAEIEAYFKRPLHFVNDANASGYAEWWKGEQHRNFCMLFVEAGVGGALLLKNSPYLGDNLRSAEFGHMVVVKHGALCSCGKKGCLEAYCSTDRLSVDFDVSLDAFFAELPQNTLYANTFERYLECLAIGIANLRFFFDCNISLGGHIVPYLLQHEQSLRESLRQELPFDKNTDFLQFSTLKDRGAALGAALFLVNGYIESIQ